MLATCAHSRYPISDKLLSLKFIQIEGFIVFLGVILKKHSIKHTYLIALIFKCILSINLVGVERLGRRRFNIFWFSESFCRLRLFRRRSTPLPTLDNTNTEKAAHALNFRDRDSKSLNLMYTVCKLTVSLWPGKIVFVCTQMLLFIPAVTLAERKSASFGVNLTCVNRIGKDAKLNRLA
jgi:hypothetical protein